MALALYRRHRPATFAELVGQEHVTEPLRTALGSGRINHAYLFSGPRGCGKTSSARILARSLNCVDGPTPDPCGVCPSCVALAPEGPGSIDVVELDAASHGGVDDARDLRDRAFYAPAESRYRVFIIDEAHMVTTQGFNALLKIVEEPPEHLVFVFATTEPEKVLATIRSRTHHYPFRLLPPGTLRRLLERICAHEGVAVEPSVFPLVVRAGGGSARDSLSVMDQLLAGAGPDGVRYERAVALLGVSDGALIDDVVDGLAAGDGAAVFGAVERLVDAGHDPRRFAADLLERFRDLTLIQAIPDAAGRGLVDGPDDAIVRITAQADRIGPAALARYGEIVHSGLIEMRGATAPRLLLELLCARMLLPAASADEPAVLHRLELLERRLTLVPATEEQAPPQRFEAPARRRATEAAEPPPARASVERPVERPVERASEGTAERPAGRAAERAPERPADRAPERSTERAAERAPERAERPVERRPEPAVGRPEGAAEPARTPAASAQRDAAPQEQPAAPAQQTPASGGLDAAAVRRAWSGLLDEVRERSRVTQVLLSSATVHSVDGDTLVLTIGSGALARQLSEERHVEKIVDALHAVLGGTWRIRCEPPDAGGSGGTSTSTGAGGNAAGGQRPASGQQNARPGTGQRQPRSFEPPARGGNGRSAPPPPPDEPLPPEPPDLEPDDEDAMLAEAATAPEHDVGDRRDPEEVALELLANQLGARKIDDR